MTAEKNGMMRLYVNGQEEGTAVSLGTLFPVTANILIGSAGQSAGNGPDSIWNALDGSVDDVRAYQQALTAADVRAVYDEVAVIRDGYWALDGDLNDPAGGNTGTFNGTGPASYPTGMFGSALSFNGTNNYVSIPYGADPENYTFSAWVKPTDTTSVNIITRTDSTAPSSSSPVYAQLRINSSGKFEHYTVDNTGGHTVTGATVVRAGVWYQVTGVAQANGLMRLYVNGVEEGTSQAIGTLSTSGDRYYLGSQSSGGMGWFSGSIDDVHVYHEAASAADIRDWFLRGEPTDYVDRWNFENNLSDSTGGITGQYLPGSATYSAGKQGTALAFPPLTAYNSQNPQPEPTNFVNLDYASNPSSYTLSAWVKPATRRTPQSGSDPFIPMTVFVRTDSSGALNSYTDMLRITMDDNVARFEYIAKSDTGIHLITGTTQITEAADTWYHVATRGREQWHDASVRQWKRRRHADVDRQFANRIEPALADRPPGPGRVWCLRSAGLITPGWSTIYGSMSGH